MRTLKITLLAVLGLAMGATAANAASVDVIWQVSGTASTTIAGPTVLVGDIILTPTTPLAGSGTVIELSADVAGSVTTVSAAQVLLGGWIALGVATIGTPHSENVIAQGDLLGFGAPVAGPTLIGTITVNATGAGTATVQASGPADDIFSGPVSVLGEYVFNAGVINAVPEPTTAGLMGLGLMGLLVAGRRR